MSTVLTQEKNEFYILGFVFQLGDSKILVSKDARITRIRVPEPENKSFLITTTTTRKTSETQVTISFLKNEFLGKIRRIWS